MPRDAAPTRAKILQAGLDLILETGYSAASVERIIQRAGVTKGTFFYHFATKQALAHALVQQWAEADIRYLDDNLARAQKLASDPAQQLMIFVGLFEEMFESNTELPGCLYASFCYEADLLDASTAQDIRKALDTWRERLVPIINAAIEQHPPRADVTAEDLADMLTVIFEGGFIMSRIYSDPKLTGRQLRQFRNYLEMMFRE